MEDEFSLPRLVPDSQTEPLTLNLRKRVRLSSPAAGLSSDPPIFSSDDDDPSADNYTNLRRKKIYRGPWYRQELVDGKEKSKRTLQRQVDSGVWMGSDGTDLGDVSPDFEELAKASFENKYKGIPKPKLPEISPEAQAESYIETCLDNGNESISLIACGLRTLSNRAIQLLSTFTCAPDTEDAPFQTLEPKLKLLLSKNYFVRIPREILNLQHLQVLSFRANEIREIPAAICQLQQLVELNVANNCLHFLPFEILELFKENTQLREFHIHPNPFYEPDQPAKPETNVDQDQIGDRIRRPLSNAILRTEKSLTDEVAHPYWRATHRFSSPISFFNIKGTLATGPAIPAYEDELPQKFPTIEPGTIQSPPGNNVSAAPSLLEVALRACYQSTQLPYLADLLHSETPSYFSDLLSKAQMLKEAGAQICTICGREFIITRTSWIEWWEISKTGKRNGSAPASAASPLRSWEEKSGRDQIEAMVPLMRRGCSWKCYQQAPA